MGRKLYVGNLSYESTEEQVKEFFSKAGTVDTVNLIMDREQNRPKGFGFVEMATDEEAKKAIEQLNEQELDGRKLVVNEAKPMQKRNREGGGYSVFGGGNRNRY